MLNAIIPIQAIQNFMQSRHLLPSALIQQMYIFIYSILGI